MQDIVVALKRGKTLASIGCIQGATLAMHLQALVDCKIVDVPPGGRSVTISIHDQDIARLRDILQVNCFIFDRAMGRSTI
jgi:hypothetical protein